MVMTDEEIEAARQGYLVERIADDNVVDTYEPGSNGYHEAVDRAALIMNLLDRELLFHPAIVNDAENCRLCQQAFDKLWDLYQTLGRKHLAEPE